MPRLAVHRNRSGWIQMSARSYDRVFQRAFMQRFLIFHQKTSRFIDKETEIFVKIA